MTMPRLVAPRLDDPATAPAASPDPPVLVAIRCIFGVGVEPGATPDGDGLRPVYRVELPVNAPGSLDAEGLLTMRPAHGLGIEINPTGLARYSDVKLTR